MTGYVALLRGVNVGGHNLVPMASLPPIFTSLGFRDVATFIASGNVVFAADRLDRGAVEAIEARLAGELGRSIGVVLRSHAELAACVAANPYPQGGPKSLHLVFMADVPTTASLDRLVRARQDPDELTVTGRDIYLHCPAGIGRSKLAGAASSLPGDRRATVRNWNTVTKLLDLTTGRDR